jgi:small-conductance mechanosensitive channel
VVVYLLLSRVRSCVAWWNSLNPLERELLTFLLLFYYGSISVIIVIFTLHLVLPFLISPGGVLEGLVEGLAVGFVFAVFWFRRALLQCDKLEDFIIGKPLYYFSILSGILLGILYSSFISLITYQVFTSKLGFNPYTTLLITAILAITTSSLTVAVYLRGPWSSLALITSVPIIILLILIEEPVVLMLTLALVFILTSLFYILDRRTGVSNPIQWYFRKRREILAKRICLAKLQQEGVEGV